MQKRLRVAVLSLALALSMLLAASPVFAAPVAAPSGLVSWWPADGNVKDIQGPNNGTLMGNAGFAPGKVVQAFTFDGSGDAVRFGDVLEGVFVGQDKTFTIDMWVKVNALPNGVPGKTVAAALISKLGDSVVGPEDQRQFGLILRPDGSLDFGYYGALNGSSLRLIRAGTQMTTGSWYHLAVSYDGSLDSNNGLDRVQLYINGTAQTKTMFVTMGSLGDIPDGIANLSVGGAVASNLDVGYSLNGLIDEVEVFGRVLAVEEIFAIYNAGSDGKYRPASIDIKPGSFPNSINLGSNGVVPVAILTTPDFDAANVDPSTVTLAGAAARLKGKSGNYGSLQDVDGDGDLDLVVQVYTEDLGLSAGDTEADLTGKTFAGWWFKGTDSLRIVPPQ